MFPATGGGNQLIHSCSSVADGIVTGCPGSDQLQHRAATHVMLSTLIVGSVALMPISKNRPAPSRSTVDWMLFRISSKICSNSISNSPIYLNPCKRHCSRLSLGSPLMHHERIEFSLFFLIGFRASLNAFIRFFGDLKGVQPVKNMLNKYSYCQRFCFKT